MHINISIKIALIHILACLCLNSQTSWEKIAGPDLSAPYSFIEDQDGIIYCGTFGGKVYRTTDSGSSWQQIFNANNGFNGFIKDFALDIKSGKKYFIYNWQIYKSSGEGSDWEELEPIQSAPFVYAIVSADNSVLLAGTSNDVYKSTDEGFSWQSTPIGNDINRVISILRYGIDTILASSYDVGISASTLSISYNNGSSWSRLAQFTNELITSMAVSGLENLILTCAAGKVLRFNLQTTKIDTLWNELQIRLENVVIAGNGNIIVGTAGNGIHYSGDNGKTWEKSSGCPFDGYIYKICKLSNQTLIAGVYGWGVIFSSDNGISWSKSNSGIDESVVSGLFFDNPGSKFILTQGGGIFQTSDFQTGWSDFSSGLGSNFISSFTAHDDFYYCGTFKNGLFRRNHDKDYWESKSKGLWPNISSLAWSGENIFASTIGGGVYKSTDWAETWTEVNNGFDPVTGKNCNKLIALPDGSILAAVNQWGVYKSTNAGESWAESNTGLGYQSIYAISQSENGEIYAGGLNSGIFRSTDNGNNWSLIWETDGRTDIYEFAFSGNDTIFAGTNKGVLVSFSQGVSWEFISDGLENTAVKSVLNGRDGFIYAGVDGGGIYKYDLSPTSVPQNDYLDGIQYSIEDGNILSIDFELDNAGACQIQLFDLLGCSIVNDRFTFMKQAEKKYPLPSNGLFLLLIKSSGKILSRKVLHCD